MSINLGLLDIYKHYVNSNVLWDVYYTELGFQEDCFAQEKKQYLEFYIMT